MNKDNSIWACMREELSLDASLDKARKIRDNRNRSRCYSRKKKCMKIRTGRRGRRR